MHHINNAHYFESGFVYFFICLLVCFYLKTAKTNNIALTRQNFFVYEPGVHFCLLRARRACAIMPSLDHIVIMFLRWLHC